MLGPWYQLYITKRQSGAYVRGIELKRVDDTLTSMAPAAFVAPDGIPIPTTAKGEYEVRCFQENAIGFVRSILIKHHGLLIDREVKNDQ